MVRPSYPPPSRRLNASRSRTSANPPSIFLGSQPRSPPRPTGWRFESGPPRPGAIKRWSLLRPLAIVHRTMANLRADVRPADGEPDHHIRKSLGNDVADRAVQPHSALKIAVPVYRWWTAGATTTGFTTAGSASPAWLYPEPGRDPLLGQVDERRLRPRRPPHAGRLRRRTHPGT